MVGEVKRHQMMQNLFGDQSEEEDDEEEIESQHESNRHPTDYASVTHLILPPFPFFIFKFWVLYNYFFLILLIGYMLIMFLFDIYCPLVSYSVCFIYCLGEFVYGYFWNILVYHCLICSRCIFDFIKCKIKPLYGLFGKFSELELDFVTFVRMSCTTFRGLCNLCWWKQYLELNIN